MKDLNFGSVNSRELTLRFWMPYEFQEWCDGVFRLAPWKLLDPLRWFRTATYRNSWLVECYRHTESTHRCWCPTGSRIGGAIVICGFGVRWFYSHYTGEIPCPCDLAMDELREELETQEPT